MNRRNLAHASFAALILSLAPSIAGAQLFRAYVAPSGSDGNPCTLAAPCRLLPAAIAAAANGGEIWILDSGNYNTATVAVDRSLTILAVPGALGSVVSTGGTAAISIATPGVEVTLRNLVIAPFNTSLHGVQMTNGTSLTIENCLISGMVGSGIVVSSGSNVRVADTSIRDNGGAAVSLTGGARATISRSTFARNASLGVYVLGAAGTVTSADVIDSSLGGGQYGVALLTTASNAPVKGSIRNSVVTGNSIAGILAQTVAGSAAQLSVSDTMITNNAIGVGSSGSGAVVTTASNNVSSNNQGMAPSSGGVIASVGNNAVRNNPGADLTAAVAPLGFQ